ncbi:hypothetical protein KW543_19205 [Vibrio fluvialis]|nr:hypothetical protein [Vibrio fluvialis]
MSKSIIQIIQEEAINDSFALSSLLTKAYTVARKLELDDFSKWANSELKGYDCAGKELPDYRTPRARLMGQEWNGWIPVQMPNAEMEKVCSTAYCFESISQIEDMLNEVKGSNEACYVLNANQTNMLNQLCGTNARFALFVSRSSILRITSTVRHAILDWAIELDMNGVVGEGISFSTHEKEIAKVTTNNFIFNGDVQGIVGNEVKDNQQSFSSVTVTYNDLKALKDVFLNSGLSQSDVDELEVAIKSDDTPKLAGTYGENVSAWMGKMISKAASGGWGIGIGAAGSFIGNALSQYYGF